MYPTLLSLHSWFRWLVLGSLVYATIRALIGWKGKRTFTKLDNSVRQWTATIAQIQMTLGLCLYFISPVVEYFLHHYGEALHVRSIRFFGMEHSLMMFISVILITIGSMSAKRKKTDPEKFETMSIWFGIALLLILVSIPWPFSPFSPGRPYFR